MNSKSLVLASLFACSCHGLERRTDEQAAAPRITAAALPVQGEIPSFDGATAWLNSKPLSPDALRGKVVVVDFWTYSCINWRRQLPYVRAWAQKYEGRGLVVIGVHAPEFGFERSLDNVRWAAADMNVTYPVAVDNEFAIWRGFDNGAWPALYFIDGSGRIRHRVLGEGEYESSEKILQQLLEENGAAGVPHDVVSVGEPAGAERGAAWASLGSSENYLGSARTERFSTAFDSLALNHWAVSGAWASRPDSIRLDAKGGRIAYQFHARDLHLVMGPSTPASVRFRVLLDGKPPGASHGTDTDEQGYGTVKEHRMYQLVRQAKSIDDSRFEIEFLDADVEAFSFTFG